MRRRTAVVSALALLALPLALGAPASASAPEARPVAPVRHLMATLGSAHLPTDNRLPLVGAAPVGLPLQYGGGAVEITNHNYAIYWEPTGGTPVSPTYHSLIERFFNDVGGSALFNTTTEYYQGSSATPVKNVSSFGGSYVETKPFPAGGVTDADLQAEVAAVATKLGWATGVGNEVFVYTGPGGETVSQYCAYHSYITLGGSTLAYADEPYGGQSGCTVPSSPNNDPAADSIINTTSHELWETITDPHTGDGWTALSGDEGSDQCNFMFGTTDAKGADTYMNGHPYIVQTEWRNSKAPFGCVMS